METYTIDKLKNISHNNLYEYDHGINQKDADFCNLFQSIIHYTRSDWRPAAGDEIIKDGKKYHIDKVDTYTQIDLDTKPKYITELSVCESRGAYVPFIRAKVGDCTANISMSTSGGPWSTIKLEEKPTLKTTEKKPFCFFGHGGAKANGAVTFLADVNVWEI